MFNPFKSKYEAPQSKETVTAVIEEIHNAFDIAADQALAEANRILSQKSDPEEIALGEKLVKAGFTNVPLAAKVAEKIKADEEAKKRANVVRIYQGAYPQYKFIFLDQVVSICEKYGLVMGTADQYKGDIPKKNINEILAFDVLSEDKYFHTSYISLLMGVNEDLMRNIRRNARSYFRSEKELRSMFDEKIETDNDIIWGGGTSGVSYRKVPFFICAPRNDMGADEYTNQEGVFLTKEYPDPIVLHYVQDGFLVVSKWGIEGDDPALTNEKMN